MASSGSIRLTDLLLALSLAGDLGRGQPMGHVLRTSRIARALAGRLRLDHAALTDVYFTSLLLHAGCTAGSAEFAAFLANDEIAAQRDFCLCDPNNVGELFGWMRRNVAPGKPLPARSLRMLQMLTTAEKAFQDIDNGCSEVGSRIAQRLGLPEGTQLALYHICESWNGKGPHKLKGEDIPLAARIVNVAMILEVLATERGVAAAREAAAVRSGKSFDPAVAAAAVELCDQPDFWDSIEKDDGRSDLLESEPQPWRMAGEEDLDAVCYALADIVDLKSSAVAAHSRRTADLASAVAGRLRLSPAEVALSRRAALAHDAGLVAVPNHLLLRTGQWSIAETEKYRLHPYYTERIMALSEHLRPIGEVASAHHERTGGSGYHRGLQGGHLSTPARIVAAAAAFTEAEEATGSRDAPQAIAALMNQGLDPDCVAALAAEVGARPPVASERRSWPAGLTDREVEVLRLIAAGLNLKKTASQLVISNHTARHHVESIYSKAGVSSRAGVTLFAVENGLLD